MRCRFLITFVLAAASLAAAPAPQKPPKALALAVETQSLGSGQTGTVVGVVVQIAPEDVKRAGDRIRLVTSLLNGSKLVDRQSAVVEVEGDGSVMVYRDWPVGHYTLKVAVGALESPIGGLWAGDIDIEEMKKPFEAPEGAPVEAVALALTPPAEGAVRFKPPPDRGGIGALQLEVEAPKATASVEFFRNGASQLTRNRPPWTYSIALGEVIQRILVKAVARDKDGRYLGEDALVLNNPTGQLGVEILLGPDEAVVDGKRPVTVSVTGGAGAIDQVTLSLDDNPVARWADCPCVAMVPIDQLEKSTVASAVVVDSTGARGDAVIGLGEREGSFAGSVKVELVELPVTVLDAGGAPVTGLQPSAFAITEDGEPVAVEGFGTTADLPLSLALAVDTSGSMTDDFPAVREAARRFATDLMREGDEVIVLTFAWEATVVLPWTEDAGAIDGQLERIVPDGGTSLHDAVVRSLEQFRGRRGRQALVLLTDGEDTTSRTGWELASRFAKTMRVPIYPIGLGLGKFDFSGRKALTRLAEETGGEAFFPKTTDDLQAVYDRIGELLRSQYLIWYTSNSTKPEDEFRDVTVTVPDRPELTIRTIHGYYPGK